MSQAEASGAPQEATERAEGMEQTGTASAEQAAVTPPETLMAGELEQETGEDGEDREDKEAKKTEGAPEEYEPFAMPEGFVVNEGLMQEFTAYAKEKNLSQAEAQALIDMNTKVQAMAVQDHVAQVAAWEGEIKNDPEYGGDKLGSTIADAKRALAAYPEGKALHAVLTRTGYGSNPDVLRYLAKVGRNHFKEDDILTDRAGGEAEELPLYDRLWPDKKK